mmetsp:Transcript_23246/g.73149  ORF Transcript_23246/g.73149 Transcript_23246/m.73149 type:complete len:742 (-) Transcript_23246:50-2275(-)
MVLRDVLAEEPHALLDAEGVHGGAAPVPELGVHLLQLLVEPRHLGPLDVELEAVLADERHPDRNGLGTGNGELPPLEGLEDGPGQVHRLVQQLLHGLLGVWAVDEQHGAVAGDVLDLHRLALLHVLAHPPEIMELVVGVARDVKVILRQAHKGQLGVDLAGGREEVPQAHAAHGGQLVGDEAVEEGRSAGAADAVVGEGPVAEAAVVDHLPALAGDGVAVGGPLEGGEGVAQVGGLRVEPVGRLPAVREAELRASALEHLDDVLLGPLLVDDRPGAGPVLVEVGNDVVPSVRLLHLVPDPRGRGPLAETRGVGLRELVGGLSVLHPVHDVAREPGGVRDAVGLRARVPVVGLLVGRPDEVVAVRGPAGGTVQDGLDAGRLDGRHEARRRLHAVHEPVDVALEEPVRELGGHRALPLRGRQLHDVLALVRADEDPVALVSQVVGALEVAQDRQLMPVLLVVGLDLRDGLRDHVLVLENDRRRVNAGEASYALCPEPSAVDHPPRADNVGLTAGGAHGDLPGAVRHALHPDDLRVLVDAAAEFFGLAREGLRHGGGVNVAIALGVERSEDALGVHQGMEALYLLRPDDVQLGSVEQALVELGLGERVLRLLDPLLALQEAHGTRLVEGERDAVLVLPLLVEVHALLVPEFEVVAAVVVGHEAGRVPRRARRQRGLLEDGRRGADPGEPQLVEDGRARHAPADDRHVNVAGQVRRALRRRAAMAQRNGREWQTFRQTTMPQTLC